jgi:hypothetical protein
LSPTFFWERVWVRQGAEEEGEGDEDGIRVGRGKLERACQRFSLLFLFVFLCSPRMMRMPRMGLMRGGSEWLDWRGGRLVILILMYGGRHEGW